MGSLERSGARLLVVDDDENNRDMLSRRLIRRGFEVDIAVDGADALRAVNRHAAGDAFDLMLLDIEMPGLSGFDVLRQLRLTHDATRLPVIVATARSDREDVVAALSLGANDYVTKPLDFPVVLARVETQLSHKRAVDRILSLEAEVRRQNEALLQANARMRHSLEMAARVQRSLLPPSPTIRLSGVEFAWMYRPCDELGGDILNVFPLAGGAVGLYLLDVSGHGVPAALLSVTLSKVLAPVPGQPSMVEQLGAGGTLEPTPPNQVVAELNRRFPMGDRGGQYFTIFYGVLAAGAARIDYVSAGHPPAVVVNSNGCRPLPGENFAVGWFDDTAFEVEHLELGKGDRLVIYSDGVTETCGDGGTLFGGKNLGDVLSASAGAPLAEALGTLVAAVERFRGCTDVTDDVTMLALQSQ